MKNYCSRCDDMCEVNIERRQQSLKVKDEFIDLLVDLAVCENCDDIVFNEKLDNDALKLAFNKYREKNCLLLPDKIGSIRKKYGLSQKAFSRLLKWGEITIHRYESGLIQDEAHNEVLLLVDNPMNMKEIYFRNKNILSLKDQKVFEKHLEALLANEKEQELDDFMEGIIPRGVNEFSGFKDFDVKKFEHMVMYITEKFDGEFKTKLNKLLWYADFVCFRHLSNSMSGCQYKHHKYGPVPVEYEFIYATMISKGLIEEAEVVFPNGDTREKYKCCGEFDRSLFNNSEIKIMDFICDKFKNYSATQIKDYSHKEKGYSETEDFEQISYKYAKELSIEVI